MSEHVNGPEREQISLFGGAREAPPGQPTASGPETGSSRSPGAAASPAPERPSSPGSDTRETNGDARTAERSTSPPPELRASMAGLRLEELAPGILAIVFDPDVRRVNVLTSQTLYRLHDLIGTLRSTPDIRGVVVRSAAEGSFIAGADVNEIGDITDAETGEKAARLGQAIMTELAELDVPVVAAIDGACLGGGTELALACHYRIASDAPAVRIGLPEVRLGILPGFGGTQRLPRLVGLPRALDLVLSSRTLDAHRARRLGLIDLVIPEAIFERETARFIELLAAGGSPARGVDHFQGSRTAQARRAKISLRDRFLGTRPGLRILRRATERSIRARTRGKYGAPFVALDVMLQGWRKPLREALAVEAKALGELIIGEEKHALVHVFFLNEAAKRDRGVAEGTAGPREITRAGLLGAGVMGGGIAQILSDRGIPVRLKDLNDEAILSGLRAAWGVYRSRVRRRRLRESEAKRRFDLIQPTLDYTGFGCADVVFEAVLEKMSVKRSVLSEIESVVPEHCIVASNTSALSITELASASRRPDRVAGFHFFNPVHKMPLVEVIRGDATSDETVVTLMALARRLGKTPIVCRDGPGFLVNRILGRYMNEAGHLLADGVPVERCDRAAVEFGMPMGPIRLIDEVGIDVAAKVSTILIEQLGSRYQTNNLLERLTGDARLGRKSGRGFYRYDGRRGIRRRGRSDESAVDRSIDRYIETGGRRFQGSDREIRDRLIYVMIDEAARCLDERIVRRAGDVDVGLVFGTGFPPFRGGLLYFADTLGAADVVATLTRLAETVSPRFVPCDRLKEMAAHGRTFY